MARMGYRRVVVMLAAGPLRRAHPSYAVGDVAGRIGSVCSRFVRGAFFGILEAAELIHRLGNSREEREQGVWTFKKE